MPARGGEDEELWGVAGLLHDADYERFPDMDDTENGHPRTIMAELERRDAPPEMVRAIASHADFLGVSRDSADGEHAVRGRRAVRASSWPARSCGPRASTA